jgi:hypothetical protein
MYNAYRTKLVFKNGKDKKFYVGGEDRFDAIKSTIEYAKADHDFIGYDIEKMVQAIEVLEDLPRMSSI